VHTRKLLFFIDSMPYQVDSSRAFAALGDAWQAQGRLREPFGGGAARFQGWRLMASGLRYGYLNVGCVTDLDLADVEIARAWYSDRHTAWSALVPAGSPWPHGRLLLTHRVMALQPAAFSEAQRPAGLSLREAGAGDMDTVVAVDAGAFGSDANAAREWMEPHSGFEDVRVVIGELDGDPVATGYGLRCSGDAGHTLYVGGIAVLPAARQRGIAAALSSWLLTRGFGEGAGFAHLETDSERAARVYSRLGFVEHAGVDIYAEI
jgi:ribosomal protein S18 acetylase RimI-like enzyme